MSRDSSTLLTVRDAAQRLNVTPRTLKYYEERGLVTPTRSEGRYRLYDEHDLEQFARILRLRALGFSLHGITEMLKRPLESVGDGRRRYSQESLQQIADALAQQIGTLDARIAAVRRELKEAQTVRTELADDLDYLRQRLAGVPSETLIGERLAATRRNKEVAKTAEPQEGDDGERASGHGSARK
ncbi:MAG: MerR family transcriptional regulator [Delftia acidovorans]|jgi:DNA-binding transcriptional MerR regulator|nr:MerR family transcriptional regulator [Delftia acidovorans]